MTNEEWMTEIRASRPKSITHAQMKALEQRTPTTPVPRSAATSVYANPPDGYASLKGRQ